MTCFTGKQQLWGEGEVVNPKENHFLDTVVTL